MPTRRRMEDGASTHAHTRCQALFQYLRASAALPPPRPNDWMAAPCFPRLQGRDRIRRRRGRKRRISNPCNAGNFHRKHVLIKGWKGWRSFSKVRPTFWPAPLPLEKVSPLLRDFFSPQRAPSFFQLGSETQTAKFPLETSVEARELIPAFVVAAAQLPSECHKIKVPHPSRSHFLILG